MRAGTITAQSKVVFENRNRFGQFAKKLERQADDALTTAVKRGAQASRDFAPSGGKGRASYAKKPGYIPLKSSIRWHVSGNRGFWYSIAPHAPYVENDTRAHKIDGPLVFFWPPSPGNPRGWFVWSKPGFDNYTPKGAYVNHPGTTAQPFLEPAYTRVVKRQMNQILKDSFR